MNYCPECGSEVAPENTFCAYCGMAMTPIVPEIAETPDANQVDLSEPLKEESDSDKIKEDAESISSSISASESETAEDLPPTIMANGIYKMPEEISSPLGESVSESNIEEKVSGDDDFQTENELESIRNQEESFLPDTDLSESLKDFSEEQSESAADTDTTDNAEIPTPIEGESETLKDVPQTEVPSSWNEYKEMIEEQISDKDEQEKSAAPDFENVKNPEFEATIPYTPTDIAKQDLVAAKTGVKQENSVENQITPSSAEKNQIEEVQSPIFKPETPVGSSANDSLEPRLVSVQIYNPDEKPEQSDMDDSFAKVMESMHDSQTLIKQPAPKSGESREARSYTSPNMGKEDTAGNKAKLKPLDEGTVLNGRYEIVRKIGGGGMGAVYLASDRNLGGVLRAVKEMVQSYIEDAQQEKAINDFKRESLLLTSLEHPAIPTIYDYFYDEKEGRFYLVMKYISGGDLTGRMRSATEGRLDESTVADWGMQIADVLDYLHNRQPPIVYRDLKPSNIMIDGNSGRVMLIDFGIARWVNKEEKGVTAVGTMGYAPPELFSGNVEPRSDIYSLGSTMFHLMTGADPQSNPLLIFDFQKNPRPRQINSGLSDQIEQILMQMVEYNSDKRFNSAAELREVLRKHGENLQKGSVTFGTSNQEAAGTAAAQGADGLVFCGFCGQKIVATDVFCPFCGAQQPLAGQSAVSAQSYAAPKLTAKIFIIGTNELDAPVYNLEKDTNLVGRRDPMSNIFPEVDLSKYDPQTKISRKHARIWRESDKFMVEDLGSSNGTVLMTNSSEPQRLMKNQPHVLSPGDKIRVGDTTLHFVLS